MESSDRTNLRELLVDTPLIDCIGSLNEHLLQKGFQLLTPADLACIAAYAPCQIKTLADLEGVAHWSDIAAALEATSAPITKKCDHDGLREIARELSLYRDWSED